jgi:hypothetical protein
VFNCTVRLDSSNEFAVVHGFDFGEAVCLGWPDNLRLNGYTQQLDRSGPPRPLGIKLTTRLIV